MVVAAQERRIARISTRARNRPAVTIQNPPEDVRDQTLSLPSPADDGNQIGVSIQRQGKRIKTAPSVCLGVGASAAHAGPGNTSEAAPGESCCNKSATIQRLHPAALNANGPNTKDMSPAGSPINQVRPNLGFPAQFGRAADPRLMTDYDDRPLDHRRVREHRFDQAVVVQRRIVETRCLRLRRHAAIAGAKAEA